MSEQTTSDDTADVQAKLRGIKSPLYFEQGNQRVMRNNVKKATHFLKDLLLGQVIGHFLKATVMLGLKIWFWKFDMGIAEITIENPQM